MSSHEDQPLLRGGAGLAEARAVLILLHAHDSDAEEILGLSAQLAHDGLAYLAPQADDGRWFPYSFLVQPTQNADGVDSALTVLASLVTEADLYGVPPDRVVLLGFAEGGCLAAEFALRYPRRYGGICVLSGGLMGPPGTDWVCQQSLSQTPVFIGCSDVDPHIPRSRIEETREVLVRFGADVTMKLYHDLGHAISAAEIAEVNRLLISVLNGTPAPR
jgi:predicted esterase